LSSPAILPLSHRITHNIKKRTTDDASNDDPHEGITPPHLGQAVIGCPAHIHIQGSYQQLLGAELEEATNHHCLDTLSPSGAANFESEISISSLSNPFRMPNLVSLARRCLGA